jgi:hypothetical protein
VHVRLLNGKPSSPPRATSVHHQWPRLAEGQRFCLHAAKVIETPMEIKRRLAGPYPTNDGPPFLPLVVAIVVLVLFYAEHAKLVFVPATHHVDTQSPCADMVDGGSGNNHA